MVLILNESSLSLLAVSLELTLIIPQPDRAPVNLQLKIASTESKTFYFFAFLCLFFVVLVFKKNHNGEAETPGFSGECERNVPDL